MRPIVILRGVLAGLLTIAGWHAAVVVSWLFEGTIPIILCGVVTGLLVNLLLFQRGTAKFFTTLLTGLLIGFLAMVITNELGVVQLLMKQIFPGFWRITVGSNYAIMVVSLIFFAVIAFAVLVAVSIRPRTVIIVKEKEEDR